MVDWQTIKIKERVSMLDQDTFINMLNMIYPTVSIISKKEGNLHYT